MWLLLAVLAAIIIITVGMVVLTFVAPAASVLFVAGGMVLGMLLFALMEAYIGRSLSDMLRKAAGEERPPQIYLNKSTDPGAEVKFQDLAEIDPERVKSAEKRWDDEYERRRQTLDKQH